MEDKDDLVQTYRTNYEKALKYCQQKDWTKTRESLEASGRAVLKIIQIVDGTDKERYMANAKSLARLLEEVKSREQASGNQCLTPIDSSLNTTKFEQKKDESAKPKSIVEQALKELNKIEGLKNVKEQILQYVGMLDNRQKRIENNLPVCPISYNMIFRDGISEEKFIIAKIMAKILYSIGAFNSDRVVKVNLDTLLGDYVGETAKNTQKVIDDAKGGFLFLEGIENFCKYQEKTFYSELYGVLTNSINGYLGKEQEEITYLIFSGNSEELDKFFYHCEAIRLKIGTSIIFDKN